MEVCEKAAEHGVLAAQLMLARTSVVAGASDHHAVRAYVWFSMAIDQLIRSRDKVKRIMTTAQLTEAERQFRERLNRLLELPVRAQAALKYERSA